MIERRPFRLADYISKPIWCNIMQVVERWSSLRIDDEAHVTELRESFLSSQFVYTYGMSTVAFSHDMHHKVKSREDMVNPASGTSDGFSLLSGLHARVVDGRHHYHVLSKMVASPRMRATLTTSCSARSNRCLYMQCVARTGSSSQRARA